MICTNRGGHPSLLSIAQSAARFTVSKSLGEIDEEQVEVLVLLNTFFLELPNGEDHIHRAPLLSEATLALRHNIIQYVFGDPVQHDTGQYLAYNAEEADPAVVVAG